MKFACIKWQSLLSCQYSSQPLVDDSIMDGLYSPYNFRNLTSHRFIHPLSSLLGISCILSYCCIRVSKTRMQYYNQREGLTVIALHLAWRQRSWKTIEKDGDFRHIDIIELKYRHRLSGSGLPEEGLSN